MANNEGRATKVMCVDCKGIGAVGVLGRPEYYCEPCGGTGSIVQGVDNEKVKLRAENKRLKGRIETFEMKYESSGSIFGRGMMATRIKELKEALEFYADYSNWTDNVKGEGLSGQVLHYQFTKIQSDKGIKARQALEESE